MNRRARRILAGGCVVMAGAFVSVSVDTWAQASTPVSAASMPSPTASSSASAIATPALQEDDPGWDCHTMGNKVCGPVEVPWLADAWDSFDGKRVAESVGPTNAARALSITYVGTYSTEPHWPGYTVVASKVYLGIFHVFKTNSGN